MGFLIAEILGLLVLAAIGGGVFVYWWVRRRSVDGSSEHAHLRTQIAELDTVRQAKSQAETQLALAEAETEQLRARLQDELGWRKRLLEKLDTMTPEPLTPVLERLGTVETSVAKLENTDLSAVEATLGAVAETVSTIRPPDLGPVEGRLDRIETAVASLRNADLSTVEEEVGAVRSTLGAVDKKISAIRPAEVAPIERRLTAMDKHVRTLRNPDLSRVDSRVESVADAVTRLERRTPTSTDVSGIRKRLDAIEKALKDRPRFERHRTAPKTRAARKTAPARRKVRQPGANLLAAPRHGKPDDLKRISGVGPKLERMLNDMGVYYFWQVSDWRKADVAFVDDRLPAFKGRIARDGWVRQASALIRETGATPPPSLRA